MVTFEAATVALRTSVHFYSANLKALARNGLSPAESASTLYFLPPWVTAFSLMFYSSYNSVTLALRTNMMCY